MESAPWLLVFPATFPAVSLFSFNFIGDSLRDALDRNDGDAEPRWGAKSRLTLLPPQVVSPSLQSDSTKRYRFKDLAHA
jgi:hypothetical protein